MGAVPEASREVRAIVSARSPPPSPIGTRPRAAAARAPSLALAPSWPSWRVVRWILLPVAGLLGVLAVAGVAVAAYVYWPTDLPPVKALEEYTPSVGSRVYAGDDEFITEFQAEKRIFVPLQQIPPTLRNAIIAVEDSRFYSHFGVDVRGILRAAYANFRHGRVVEGGSTITQQLAKVLFLTPDRSFSRKVKEALLAFELEKRYSKDRLLELYLNQVYMGHGAFGVEAAARMYFGKSVQDLSLPEAAMLAALPRSPGNYSPFERPELAQRRRAIVVGRLLEHGYISEAQAKATNRAPLGLVPSERRRGSGQYFLEYLQQSLEAKYGSDVLYKSGLAIYTTLDPGAPAGGGAGPPRRASRRWPSGRARAPPPGARAAPAPVAARGGGRGDRGRHRLRQGADRRGRLRADRVQPRAPRASPAGVGLQAVRLPGGARGRPRADRDPRRQPRPLRLRGQGLGARELRRQVPRPGHAPAGPRGVDQRADHPAARADRREAGHRRGAARGHPEPAPARPHARARQRRRHAPRAHRGLRHVRQPGHPHGAADGPVRDRRPGPPRRGEHPAGAGGDRSRASPTGSPRCSAASSSAARPSPRGSWSGPSRGRPARPTTSRTPGSWATRRRSWPGSGSGTIGPGASATRRRARAPRSRSGSSIMRTALRDQPVEDFPAVPAAPTDAQAARP